MTHESSTGEDGRELMVTDKTARRSIREMLAVLHDRPSVLIGLVVALLGQTILVAILSPLLMSMEAWLLLAVGPQWITTVALVGFVLWVERRPLASIGVARPTWSDLWLGLVGAVVGLLTLPVTISLRDALGLGMNEGFLRMILQFPVWAVLLIAVTAAVTEEVLFRAYPIERIAEITGSVWAGAVVSFVAFVILHLPAWGVGHLITISGISIVLIVLYVRYRRLGPVVVMHFLTDFFLLIVLPTLGWI